jgi:hypothetical protein
VVYTKGLGGWSGIAIGGMVGLDIFFFSFISGASMNPARSLAPALLSGAAADLWLYWSATFAGSVAVALICRKISEFMREILDYHSVDVLAMSGVTLGGYKRAYRRLMMEKERKGFIVHLIVYAAVNSVLIAFNLLIDPEVIWFVFPLIAWASALPATISAGFAWPQSTLVDIPSEKKIAHIIAYTSLILAIVYRMYARPCCF